MKTNTKEIAGRLAYLRTQIDAECISLSEIAELQSLAPHIHEGDTTLREWAGVPEYLPNVYDNGGETWDRYTVVYEDGDVLGLSEDPDSPQGFSQYAGNINTDGITEGPHLGALLPWDTIPENIRAHIIMRGNQ